MWHSEEAIKEYKKKNDMVKKDKDLSFNKEGG